MIPGSSPPRPPPPTATGSVLSVLGSLLQVASWQSISSVPTSPPRHPQGLRLIPRAAAGTEGLHRDIPSGKVMPGATNGPQSHPGRGTCAVFMGCSQLEGGTGGLYGHHGRVVWPLSPAHSLRAACVCSSGERQWVPGGECLHLSHPPPAPTVGFALQKTPQHGLCGSGTRSCGSNATLGAVTAVLLLSSPAITSQCPLAHLSGEPGCCWHLLGILPAWGEGSERLSQPLSPGP